MYACMFVNVCNHHVCNHDYNHDYMYVYIYNSRVHEHMHSTRDVYTHTNAYTQLTQELAQNEAHRTIFINLPVASRCFCRRLLTQERAKESERECEKFQERGLCVCTLHIRVRNLYFRERDRERARAREREISAWPSGHKTSNLHILLPNETGSAANCLTTSGFFLPRPSSPSTSAATCASCVQFLPPVCVCVCVCMGGSL